MDTIKKNKETLIDACERTGLEVNVEKSTNIRYCNITRIQGGNVT
jgi:hypothetical protein